MKTLTACFLALFLVLPVFTSAQTVPTTQLFLKLEGLEGESVQPGHLKEIDALSFSFGTGQTGLTMAGGTASPAKAQFSPLQVIKRPDKASPMLFLNCAIGKVIPTARITFRRTNSGDPQDFFILDLTNVLISSYQVSGAEDDPLTESIGLSYLAIKVTFRPTQNGQLGPPISTSFNVVRNKPGDETTAGSSISGKNEP
ncbi:MAG: type secretion system secreted protein Hcp [Chthoniobacter sp.]|jgi:type VI secretion system secreted protein Hcp|nr:type secretion system secreted protein Hcp [Chthoniobacter sp.]